MNFSQAIGLALKLHGEGLEVLDLAGCGGLDSPLTMATIRQQCKCLVALDLSGPFGEDLGEAGAPPGAGGAFAGRRGLGYGPFQVRQDKNHAHACTHARTRARTYIYVEWLYSYIPICFW